MVFAAAAVERAMKVQEVIMRALSGALSWLQAADILGIDPRSLRRWRARYEAHGVLGLYDGRRGQPSRRKAPVGEVQRILRLYQDGYRGWNVRHFYRFAQLWPSETTHAVMSALRHVFTAHGLPIALYTDRAGWAFHTPKAGGRVDRTHLTQVGRALAHLGIEHIPSYSPQGRGRSERLNRTLQGRLINELDGAGITTVAAANTYLTERFIPDYNDEFARPPADPASAFVPLHGVDLDSVLCQEEERSVGQDNVVVLEQVPLQLAKQPGRRSCAGLRVIVRRHLSGQHSVWHGTRCLGHYDGQGRPLPTSALAGPSMSHRPPRPKNARAHLPQGPRSAARQGSGIPSILPRPKRRSAPRLPVGPRQ